MWASRCLFVHQTCFFCVWYFFLFLLANSTRRLGDLEFNFELENVRFEMIFFGRKRTFFIVSNISMAFLCRVDSCSMLLSVENLSFRNAENENKLFLKWTNQRNKQLSFVFPFILMIDSDVNKSWVTSKPNRNENLQNGKGERAVKLENIVEFNQHNCQLNNNIPVTRTNVKTKNFNFRARIEFVVFSIVEEINEYLIRSKCVRRFDNEMRLGRR